MRFSLLLPVLWLASATLAIAGPPGYRSHRRYYTASGRPYNRPQTRVHLSLNLAYYNGDLTSRLSDNTLQPGYGIGVTQALTPRLTFAAELSRVRLKAQDQFPDRGFSFEGNNGVLTALLRFNLLEDKSMYVGLNQKKTPVQPFLEAGLATMLYSPTAYLGGGITRQTLPAEPGQNYPGVAGAIPVGGGVTLRASQRLFFTLDALYYFTSTDLLDDISQRGNPKKTDDFATVTFKAEFVFGAGKRKPLVHND